MNRAARNILACLLAALLLWSAGAAAEGYPYQSVLDMTLAGILAEEEPEGEEFNAFCRLMTLPGDTGRLDAVGYAFADLDGDGAEELIIGETARDEILDGMILDIWTMREGTPALVCRGWDRYRFYLIAGEEAGTLALYTEGSSGASESQFEYGVIREGTWQVLHRLDFNAEAASPWSLDGEPCDEEAAQLLLRDWESRKLDPMLQPFSSLLVEAE